MALRARGSKPTMGTPRMMLNMPPAEGVGTQVGAAHLCCIHPLACHRMLTAAEPQRSLPAESTQGWLPRPDVRPSPCRQPRAPPRRTRHRKPVHEERAQGIQRLVAHEGGVVQLRGWGGGAGLACLGGTRTAGSRPRRWAPAGTPRCFRLRVLLPTLVALGHRRQSQSREGCTHPVVPHAHLVPHQRQAAQHRDRHQRHQAAASQGGGQHRTGQRQQWRPLLVRSHTNRSGMELSLVKQPRLCLASCTEMHAQVHACSRQRTAR